MPLTAIVEKLEKFFKRRLTEADIHREQVSGQFEQYLQEAQTLLEEGKWSGASSVLHRAENLDSLGLHPGKDNPQVEELIERTRQMSFRDKINYNINYARAALAELSYREGNIDAQELALRQAESGSLASLMKHPDAISKLGYEWVTGALGTAGALANGDNLKLPDDYSSLKTKAYSIGVIHEMRKATAAIEKKDYYGAELHLEFAQRNAKEAGIEFPSDFEELQRKVDFYLRLKKLVSEEVKQEYDLEFKTWYEDKLGVKAGEDPDEALIQRIGRLAPWDPYSHDICRYFLMEIKTNLGDTYFRSRLNGEEHAKAFEDSIGPLRDIIESVKSSKLPDKALRRIKGIAQDYANPYGAEPMGLCG